MEPSANAAFIVSHVFEKAGPARALLFVPLLRQWASEGKVVHGKRFSLEDVEEALQLQKLFSLKGAGAPAPTSFVPTPTRAIAQARAQEALRKPASHGELLQHSSSCSNLAQQPPEKEEKLSLGVPGSRMEVRANPPRLKPDEESPEQGVKRRKLEELEMVAFGPFEVPRLTRGACVPQQTLRISAGRAAAAAGIHPYSDVGDLFLEFVYQDLPDLLLHDAALAGVEVVSPMAERAKLLAKSGAAAALTSALQAAAASMWVQGVHDAQQSVRELVVAAEQAGKLSPEEASDLKSQLELEMNLEFGARHEDAAIEAYSKQVKAPVYGQQRRVSLAMPHGGAVVALAEALPPLRPGTLPSDEDQAKESKAKESRAKEGPDPAFFRLTGFVDGIVDLNGPKGLESFVVEVKHRVAKIKDPPNLYDVVQLCSYCRVYGVNHGHLVQCLREESPGCSEVGKLTVSALNFSAGSPDRKGWDEHVLPALYKVAAAVYATRNDPDARLRLLAAPTAAERVALVGTLCPHLDR